MKRIISLLLCALLALSLCACGGAAKAEPEKPANMSASLPNASSAPEETEEAEAAPEAPSAAEEAVKLARKLKNRPVSELLEQLGEKSRIFSLGMSGGGAQSAVLGASGDAAGYDDYLAAIGAPESSDYAPSCLGPGEDVNLYYDGFTVYTYRDSDQQVVVDAEVSK